MLQRVPKHILCIIDLYLRLKGNVMVIRGIYYKTYFQEN